MGKYKKKSNRNIVSKRYLQRLQNKVNLPNHTCYDLTHINDKIDKAYKEYKQAKQKAELLRRGLEICTGERPSKQQ